MNNLQLRIISSIFLIPIIIYLIYLNNIYFKIFLFVIFVASIYELKFAKNHYLFYFCLLLMILFIFLLYNLRGNSLEDFYNLLWFITIVWLSDIGGYVFGKLIKGPKLSKLSPNKTISGFFGSLIFAQFSFMILFVHNLKFIYSEKHFVIQFILSLISIFGDLFFSYIKRKFKIKDFSNIIPGHGGVLDRIDGLIFVIIFGYIFKFNYA